MNRAKSTGALAPVVSPSLRPGLWETDYGNVAYLARATAKTAHDLDANERIPVAMLSKFLRPGKPHGA